MCTRYNTHTTTLISLLSCLFLLSACGGDDGDDSNGASGGGESGCASDSDCAGGQACDLGAQGQALSTFEAALTTSECIEECPGFCAGDTACEDECADACADPTCDNLCHFFCDGDAGCTGQCVPECEASEGGSSGGTGGGGNNGDEGSTGGGGATDSGGGSAGADNTSGGGGGVCRSVSGGDSGSSGGDSGSSGGDSGPTEETIEWSGSWDARVIYSVSCDMGFDNIKKEDHDHRVTLHISGTNDALEASIDGGYSLTGSGNERRMSLNGQFPVRDSGGEVTSGAVVADNQISVIMDSIIDINNASGSIEGQFEGRFGADCSLDAGGLVELVR